MSGNTLLVSVITPTAGRVIVYNRSAPGAQWVLAQTLTGDTQTEYFGNSVTLDGDTAVVGADNADAVQLAGRGAVYVFTRSGGTWTRSQRVPAPPEATNTALFGSSVALRGDWLAVNARNDGPNRDGNRGTAGSTYLYRRSGPWTLHRKLVPDPEVAQETGWEATAIQGGTLVIGAHRGVNPVSPFTYGGAAYVYTLDAATGTWSATPQKLPVADLANYAAFGRGVTVEGNRMAIGASGVDNRGRVYTYTRDAGGLWVEDGSFSRNDLTVTSFFGERVALDQGRLAVAAGNSSGAAGRVFVYTEGGPLQAVTGDSYALGATNASLQGTVLSDTETVPVTFEYGVTKDYGQSLSANPPTLLTTGTDQLVYLSISLLLPQTTYHYRVRAGSVVGGDRTFTTGPFDAGVSGPDADPDRDGLTNLEEACFGTAPLSATPGQLAPDISGGALYVAWQEPLAGNGVAAMPEWSPDGLTWLVSGQSAPGIAARTIPVTLTTGGGGNPLIARLDSTGQPHAMLRLRCLIIP